MRFVFIMLAALVLLTGSAQALEIDVYPQDTLWTGGVYYIPSWPYWGFWWENPITWGNFFWMTTPCNERGFARYDLAPIPDHVNVTAATVHYFVYWDTLNTAAEIRLLTVLPFPDSEPQAQEIYDSISAGTLVATVDSTVVGWNAVVLGEPALRAIEERVLTTDWLGLGWTYPGTDSADAVARGWRSDSLKTYLTVEYVLTGVEERASGGWRVASYGPTIVSGVLNLRPTISGLRSQPKLLDAGGRVVMELRPGDNDVRGLAPGVYFVRTAQAQAQAQAAPRKIVLE